MPQPHPLNHTSFPQPPPSLPPSTHRYKSSTVSQHGGGKDQCSQDVLLKPPPAASTWGIRQRRLITGIEVKKEVIRCIHSVSCYWVAESLQLCSLFSPYSFFSSFSSSFSCPYYIELLLFLSLLTLTSSLFPFFSVLISYCTFLSPPLTTSNGT